MVDGEPIPTGLPENGKQIPIPYGERVIGRADPRILTENDFNGSPEVLLHAAAKPFDFSPSVDYETLKTDNSSTAGRGLYTTDNGVSARKYLEDRRAGQGGENAILMKFLPYQARMYDMRAQNNEADNAPVPKDFFVKYRQFVIDYFKSRFPNGAPDISQHGQPNWLLYETLREHKAFLNKLYFGKGEGNYEPVDLRVMLGTDGTMSTSEKGSIPFTLFMLKQGYDGLIYHEGGDGWYDTAPSYVFYNPKKIGTYQSWQQDVSNNINKAV